MWWRPARPRLALRLASANTLRIMSAATSTSGSAQLAAGGNPLSGPTRVSVAGTSRLVPGGMKSRFPEKPVAMTAFPAAIALAMVRPKPSARWRET